MTACEDLVEVLRLARALLARPGNDFSWSSWEDAPAALAEIDRLIQATERGHLPQRLEVAVLFAPTGPIQEVSLSSGWATEFLSLAEVYDGVEKRCW